MAVRHTIGLALMAALVLGAGLVFSPVAAQNAAPAAATPARILPVTANLRGAPPTGPHAVVIEHDQTLATHTIYRPADLGSSKHRRAGLGRRRLREERPDVPRVPDRDSPPTASSSSLTARRSRTRGRAAVAAPGRACGRGGAAGGCAPAPAPAAPAARPEADRAEAVAAAHDRRHRTDRGHRLDREGRQRPASRFYQKVETGRVAAMGMSCGGLMSYGASADPRVATVGIWNSGLIQPDEKIFAGLHSPVIIVTGGEKDIAYANGKRDFETMPAKIPVFYGVYPSVGHGGTYNEDNGGAFGVAAVAWLKWQLMNDTSASGKGYFVGSELRHLHRPEMADRVDAR